MTELDLVLEKPIANMLYEVHKVALIVAGQSDETTEAILDDLREGLEDLIPADTWKDFARRSFAARRKWKTATSSASAATNGEYNDKRA